MTGTAARKITRFIVAAVFIVPAVLVVGLALLVAGNLLFRSPGWNHTAAAIRTMEASLVKMRTDSHSKDLPTLFDANKLNEVVRERELRGNLNAFEASTEVYTVAFTTLLEHGRKAAEVLAGSDSTKDIASVLNPEALKTLATGYDLMKEDSWGGRYNFFLGPWPQEWGPIVFRTYRIEGGTGVADPLTVEIASDSKKKLRVGFLAQTMEIYIWSPGPNGVSDQPVFDPGGKYAPPASRHYRADAPPEYLGGGDDINNWDPDRTWGFLHHEQLR